MTSILQNFKRSLDLGRGLLLGLGAAVLIAIALVWRGGGRYRWVALLLAMAAGLHMIFGAYGWVNRYEVYMLAAVIWSIGSMICVICQRRGYLPEPRLALVLVPLLIISGFPYLQGLLLLPIACNNTWEQQYQMHRFVADYWKKPVAVNDLGWVSFDNDQYVLDLWGLASARALQARLKNEPSAWMTNLADQHDVGLAMIYSAWYPALPSSWEQIAVIRLSRKLVTPAGPEVAFYSTRSEEKAELISRLKDFRNSLPKGVVLQIAGD